MARAIKILGYLLAAFMAFMGVQKFIGGVPIFEIIESSVSTQWGLDLPWIDPWFRFLTGALEIVAAILLVIGRRFAGGGLSLLITIGAVAAHLTVLGIETPMSGEPDATSSPALFIMAVIVLAVAGLVTFAARKPVASI